MSSKQIYKCLYPLSFLYGIGVRIRNALFDWGFLRSQSFDVPVISVGNITVGGTGKTPHVEYLVRLLRTQFHVAVLSRGYKRKSSGFLEIGRHTPVEQSGDEPFQMKQKFPDIPVAVDKKRCRGANLLLARNPETEAILLDDAFQHRYIQPGINILLINYHRPLCNDALLPAGRLREPASAQHRANIVIVTKCPDNIKPMEYRILSKQLRLYPYQQLYFSTIRYGAIYPLQAPGAYDGITLPSLAEEDAILLLTAIASPDATLCELNKYPAQKHLLTFPDHHFFNKADMEKLDAQFKAMPGRRKIIVTTEKDATRLAQLPCLGEDIKKHIYILPIGISFLQNQQEKFNKYIIDYVTKNSRNSKLPERQDAHTSQHGHHLRDRIRQPGA